MKKPITAKELIIMIFCVLLATAAVFPIVCYPY